MDGGIRLGRIFGIEISLDYSWFIIFAIITFALAFSLFPQLIPGLGIIVYIITGIVTSILFFASVLFHELVHSVIALRNGIRVEGIRLILFGGVSQISGEARTPGIEFRMALAGPVSSLVLGGIFLGIFFLGISLNLGPIITVAAFWLGFINILLGLFNLIPGFPLDGGRVLRSAIWYFTGNLRQATDIAAGIGKGVAYTMIVGGIVGPFLTGNFGLIWFILLGWYLLRAAEAEYEQTIAQESLRGIRVGEVMTKNPETVGPGITIEEMVDKHFIRHHWVAYPVVENGDAKGMITLKSIENVPRKDWKNRYVGDVMRPLSPKIVTSPDTEVYNILPRLSAEAEGRMLVLEDGHLVGIITRTDIRRTIVRRLHLEEEESERPAA